MQKLSSIEFKKIYQIKEINTNQCKKERLLSHGVCTNGEICLHQRTAFSNGSLYIIDNSIIVAIMPEVADKILVEEIIQNGNR